MDCVTCEDSTQAFELMCEAKERGEAFQIALLDYLMPQVNGEVLARKIKASDSPVKDNSTDYPDIGGRARIRETFYRGRHFRLSFQAHPQPPADRNRGQVWHAWQNGETDGLITAENVRTRMKPEDNTRFDGARVLMAEDNRVNQGFATEILEGLGVNVAIASNGQEALDKVQQEPVRPGVDGLPDAGDGRFEASRAITDLKQEEYSGCSYRCTDGQRHERRP